MLEDGAEVVVAGRAAEAAGLLEILRGEPAGLAAGVARGLRVERGLQQQVGQREAAGVGHALGLRTGLAQIDFVDFAIYDLGEVDGRGLRAEVALEGVGHGLF